MQRALFCSHSASPLPLDLRRLAGQTTQRESLHDLHWSSPLAALASALKELLSIALCRIAGQLCFEGGYQEEVKCTGSAGIEFL